VTAAHHPFCFTGGRIQAAKHRLDDEDVRQLRAYAGAIVNYESFAQPNVKWDFWLVENETTHTVDERRSTVALAARRRPEHWHLPNGRQTVERGDLRRRAQTQTCPELTAEWPGAWSLRGFASRRWWHQAGLDPTTLLPRTSRKERFP